MTTFQLYDYAEQNNVEVYNFPLGGRKALSIPLEGGVCAVAMDTFRMTASDEKEALAHELGHCMTHTFYTPVTPMVTRARCEVRAIKWAIRHIIPEASFMYYLRQGRELWELADIFEVDPELIEKAANLYLYNHI